VIRKSHRVINPQKALIRYSFAASSRSRSSPSPICRSASMRRSSAPSALAFTTAISGVFDGAE